jgi:hypothetical protein
VSAPVRTTKEAARQAAIERIRPYRWKPGKSANPGGKPKHDVAKELANAIFENNEELIYQCFLKALSKGNAYCFQVLADRGYGKLKEQHAVEVNPYSHLSDEELEKKIHELEEKLGVRRSGPVLLPPAR